MRKTVVVALREYQAAVRTKTFIISLVAMPVLMGGSIALQLFMKDKVDTRDKRVAIVDHTGALYAAVERAAEDRNRDDITNDDGKQIKPRFLIEPAVVADSDPDRVALTLSDRVRDEDLLAFVIIGPEVIEPGEEPTRGTIAYYSNSPTYSDFRRWLSEVLNGRIRQIRLANAGLDEQIVERATTGVGVADLGLVSVDESGGELRHPLRHADVDVHDRHDHDPTAAEQRHGREDAAHRRGAARLGPPV